MEDIYGTGDTVEIWLSVLHKPRCRYVSGEGLRVKGSGLVLRCIQRAKEGERWEGVEGRQGAGGAQKSSASGGGFSV